MNQYVKKDIIHCTRIFAAAAIITAIVAALASCTTTRTITAEHRDSIRTETRIVKERHIDTIQIYLPMQTAHRETRDTTSTLSTAYATSTATISGGTLTHTLNTNPAPISVQVVKEVEYRDSIQHTETIRHEPYEVKVPAKLNLIQRAAPYTTAALLALIAIIAAWLYLKRKKLPL